MYVCMYVCMYVYIYIHALLGQYLGRSLPFIGSITGTHVPFFPFFCKENEILEKISKKHLKRKFWVNNWDAWPFKNMSPNASQLLTQMRPNY